MAGRRRGRECVLRLGWGLPATSQDLLQGNPEQGDRFGAALVAGFFNADQGDLAVGAPGEDVGSAGGAGAVSVFSGTPGGLPTSSQVLLQANPEVGDQFGLALAAGFFSASIFNDLAVGAPTETVGGRADAGAVSVFLGSASQLGEPPPRPWSRVRGRRRRRGRRRVRVGAGGRVLRHRPLGSGHRRPL